MALYFIVGARSLNLKHHHEYGVTSKLRYFFSVLETRLGLRTTTLYLYTLASRIVGLHYGFRTIFSAYGTVSLSAFTACMRIIYGFIYTL